MLFLLTALCIFVILGVLVALLIISAILALGTAGIISTSFIYGLYKRSLEKAFRLFFIAASGLFNLALCSILFPVLNKIMHWTTFGNALIAGIVVGILSGSLVGFIVFIMMKRLTQWFVERCNLSR